MPPTPSTHPVTDPSPAAGGILAAFLDGRPDAARRLLDDHVDDGKGQCARCPDQTAWPCTVHDTAAAEAGRGEQ